MSGILNKISPKIEEIISDLNLYLIDMKYYKENSEFLLEIYIDSKGGLTMDQCEEATREINKYLDTEDPIEDTYTLIVSSPGLDRPLKTNLDLELAIGSEIELTFYSNFNGQKKIYGNLVGFTDKYYIVKNEKDEEIEIEKSSVSKINKAIRI